MTIREALNIIKHSGTPGNQEYLNNQARYILGKILKIKRSDISMSLDKSITDDDAVYLKKIIERLNDNEPIQYIFEETEFYGIKINCKKPILIPRPDSEILVDTVLKYLDDINIGSERTIKLFEVGTGTGALALSILLNYNKKLTISSIDISRQACELAKQNYNLYADDIQLKKHCWDIKELDFLEAGDVTSKYHLIFSNPPYISLKEYRELDISVLEYEDERALTDFSDGLNFYRELKKYCTSNLYDGGFLIVEHSYNQAAAIRKIFDNEEFHVMEQVKDYGGNDRVSVIKKLK